MTRRHVVSIAILASMALTACPDREALIDEVGHAPKAQVDEAKQRLDAAARKDAARMNEAAAIPQD